MTDDKEKKSVSDWSSVAMASLRGHAWTRGELLMANSEPEGLSPRRALCADRALAPGASLPAVKHTSQQTGVRLGSLRRGQLAVIGSHACGRRGRPSRDEWRGTHRGVVTHMGAHTHTHTHTTAMLPGCRYAHECTHTQTHTHTQQQLYLGVVTHMHFHTHTRVT